MRGSSKTPPAYRKHKRSGQAVVTLSGKDIYLGPYGTKVSRAEYDRVIGEWLANGRRLIEQNAEINVKALVAAYWLHAKTVASVSSVALKALESANFAGRLEELELILKGRGQTIE